MSSHNCSLVYKHNDTNLNRPPVSRERAVGKAAVRGGTLTWGRFLESWFSYFKEQSDSPEGLVITQIRRLRPRVPDSVKLGEGPRLYALLTCSQGYAKPATGDPLPGNRCPRWWGARLSFVKGERQDHSRFRKCECEGLVREPLGSYK